MIILFIKKTLQIIAENKQQSLNLHHKKINFNNMKLVDKINNFPDVAESLLNTLGNGFTFARHEDRVFFYKVSTNDLLIPEVTTCIRIDNNLWVKLFHKGSPVPLPEWFRHGRNAKLTKKSIL